MSTYLEALAAFKQSKKGLESHDIFTLEIADSQATFRRLLAARLELAFAAGWDSFGERAQTILAAHGKAVDEISGAHF